MGEKLALDIRFGTSISKSNDFKTDHLFKSTVVKELPSLSKFGFRSFYLITRTEMFDFKIEQISFQY